MRIEGEPSEFSGDFEGTTIIDAIVALVTPYPKIAELCIENNGKKPGLLYISDKVELASLGLLNESFDEELLVRLVPILHGG
jgi:hypothetical protein